MTILFDNGVPDRLAPLLDGHSVELSRRRGWAEISNGALLTVAEEAGYEILITTDRDFLYQQNLVGRMIGVVYLRNVRWPVDAAGVQRIQTALDSVNSGEIIEVRF